METGGGGGTCELFDKIFGQEHAKSEPDGLSEHSSVCYHDVWSQNRSLELNHI